MMDEGKLIEKLRLIEALYAGATTEGEKIAAERARERILERLKHWEEQDPPIEYRFSMADMWSRKVFLALLRRYGIRPYRYHRQRYTTVMAKVPQSFVDETLWPEFQELSDTLRSYLADVTDRVVQEVIHQDSSEADVVDKQSALPAPAGGPGPRSGAPGTAAGTSGTSASAGAKGTGAGAGAKGTGADAGAKGTGAGADAKETGSGNGAKGTGSGNGAKGSSGTDSKRRNKNRRKRKKKRRRR
jgi:hypothetical protein